MVSLTASTRSLVLVLLTGLILLTALLRPSWQIGGDGFVYYAYWRSAVFDHDFNFGNEYAMFDQLYKRHYTLVTSHTPTNPFPIGPAILWTPWLAGAYALQHLAPQPDPFPLPGYNLPYQLAIVFATWTYALLGLALIFRTLRRLFSDKQAWWGTMAAVAVSPLPHYLIYEPSMAHGLTVFTTGLLFSLTVTILKSRRLSVYQTAVAGAATGLACLVRLQDVLFGLLPVMALLVKLHRRRSHQLRAGLKHLGWFAAALAIMLLPQLAMWKRLFGSWFTSPQGPGFVQLDHPRLLEFLFSGHHGMLILHPLLALAIAGIFLAWRQWRLLASLLLASLAAQIYLNASLVDWVGGASFGARRLISALFIFAFGFAALFRWSAGRPLVQRTLVTLLVAGAIFNGALMLAYAKGVIPLFGPTTAGQIYTAPFKLLK